LDDVTQDRPDAALDDIAKALDVSFLGYRPQGSGSAWMPARIFAETASILWALYWSGTHYRYLLEYALRPSWTIHGDTLFGDERRPEVVFSLLANPDKWAEAIRRAEWDELLKCRREQLLAELASLPSIAAGIQRRARWDLARSVRARNSLFHRGEPLQDEYLVAVLLLAFDIILKLRLHSVESGKAFERVVRGALRQYHEIRTGTVIPAAAKLVTLGWL
jgi:hypothetical protein